MRNLFKPLKARNLYAVAALGAVMAGAPAAFAQATVEELTVVGRLGPDGEARSLSQAVSYADLDLTLPAHQDELKQRVSATARNLCDRLGEGASYASIAPSCRDAAVRDSMEQVRFAIAEAPVRKAAMIARAEAEARARDQQAMAAEEVAAPASAVVATPTYTVNTVTNGPVPDTPENRNRYGGPVSRTGMNTAPAGN
jgi:UrcA family protein